MHTYTHKNITVYITLSYLTKSQKVVLNEAIRQALLSKLPIYFPDVIPDTQHLQKLSRPKAEKAK